MLSGLDQFAQGIGFAEYGNPILQTVGEAIIELKMEGCIPPFDSSGESVEMDQVVHEASVMVHG